MEYRDYKADNVSAGKLCLMDPHRLIEQTAAFLRTAKSATPNDSRNVELFIRRSGADPNKSIIHP